MCFVEGENFRHIKLDCLVDTANYFHEKNNFEKAIRYYQKALQIDPSNYYANIGSAGALVANRSFGESLAFFKKAASIKKAGLYALILLYIACEGVKEEDLKKEVMKEILTFLNNNEAVAYGRISYRYYKLNMFKEAEHYMNKTLILSPNEASLHYILGKIYYAEEMFEKAKHEFQKALELVSDKNEKRSKKYIISNLKKMEWKALGSALDR